MKQSIKCSYWEKPAGTPVTWFIDKAVSLGFDGMELETGMIAEKSIEELKAIRDYAKEKEIVLTLGNGSGKHLNIHSKDPSIRANAIEFRKRLIENASYAGIQTIGGALHTYWPIDYSEPVDKAGDWGRSVEGMQILGKTAADYGVCVCAEVMNRFEHHLLNTAEEGVAFCREVGHPNVKLLLDTFHMNIEDDSIPEAIRLAGPFIGHLHTGEGNRKVPGKGHLPWREIIEALADVNYQGIATMEPFVRSDGEAAKIIRVWRMLVDGGEEVMDKDAMESVQFLRNIWNSVQNLKNN